MNNPKFTKISTYSLFLLVGIMTIPAAAHAACSDPATPDVDWSGCDFAGSDLSDSDLTGADLSGGYFSGTNLSGAILVGADLSDADFTFAVFTNADMTGADAVGSDYSEANFSGATTTDADFTGSDLTDAVGNIPGSTNVSKTGGGGGGGSSNTTPPSFGKSWIDSDKQEPSLVIGEHEIIISQYQSEIISDGPITFSTDEIIPISLNLYDDGGAQGISHVGLFTDLRGNQGTNPSNSKTWIEWDGTDSDITLTNKNELFSDVSVNSEIIDNMLHIDFELTFDKPMEKSNIILYIWDNNRNAIQMNLVDVIEIVESEKQIIPQQSDEIIPEQIVTADDINEIRSVDPEPIFSWEKFNQWVGYSEYGISDEKFLDHIGIEGKDIPDWVKQNNAKWVKEGKLLQEDLIAVLENLKNRGII
jgi:hypothetical protein